MKAIYDIKGMSCQSCVARVKDALQTSVSDVSVTLNPPQAILHGDTLPDVSTVNALAGHEGKYTLTLAAEAAQPLPNAPAPFKLATYYPLFLIIALISLVSFKGAYNSHDWMMHFMAGFYIVFAFFKLLDIRGFRTAYQGYDLLAKRWPDYGYVYPFIELALGFAFLFSILLTPALWLSLFIMTFGIIGVIDAVINKRQIRCACLGTALNLPMSAITIVENGVMIAMAVWMLV